MTYGLLLSPIKSGFLHFYLLLNIVMSRMVFILILMDLFNLNIVNVRIVVFTHIYHEIPPQP